MPKRTDIESILIIGAGPIVIGQACEFDYSGTQACKTLKSEGYRIILVNSNPATIMTDSSVADSTYIEPITSDIVGRIIADERPDALLPTMGGQTALNTALTLNKQGILSEYGVEMIGARADVIDKAEDRELFREAMHKIGLSTPRALIAHSVEDALAGIVDIGFPTIIRPSFTLGGEGGGIAYNRDEYVDIVSRGLSASPTCEVLIEESIVGWKEYEMEVVRDCADNCIIVCSIENVDPMGVHTGDSITVAPALTLTDKEYQMMRDASFSVLREIGVETGGSNVQFAVNPSDGRLVVIEMNPRVSRSSALASKATGFPIAKVAARLAVGYTLDELSNDITSGIIPASFEPSLDYIVVKVPRFTFEKFPGVSQELTTSMKSVGEVMSIGRSFNEALQKAFRGLETGLSGLDSVEIPGFCLAENENFARDAMKSALGFPSPDRLLRAAEALRCGFDVSFVCASTGIDRWFIDRLEEIVSLEDRIKTYGLPDDSYNFRLLKAAGFSDFRLGVLSGRSEAWVRAHRLSLNVHPVYRRVDSCAGEFHSPTAYMYSTYSYGHDENDSVLNECIPGSGEKVIILGGGPNRIGQGIEFDYCCCHASFALRDLGYESIMVNCNPETVSTDYDTSDRLYFEPLTSEDVLELVRTESASGRIKGVIVQFGGQTPLKLCHSLASAGIEILGTSPEAIDISEDRDRFKSLLDRLSILQPSNGMASCLTDALSVASRIGYPVILRPSYVLGGRAMEVVHDSARLVSYMEDSASVLGGAPVLVDQYLHEAIEVDVDVLCDGRDVFICGIMEHIEEAGVHSGDSACSLPPHSLSREILDRLEAHSRDLALALNVQGLMNAQFAIQNGEIFVLEVNPRASRTVPFVAKVIGLSVVGLATRLILGDCLSDLDILDSRHDYKTLPYVAVKEAVFPFNRFPGVDTILGPEMRSIGEVMGIDRDYATAFAKSQLGAGYRLPTSGCVFISVKDRDKDTVLSSARTLIDLGFSLIATGGTQRYLSSCGIACTHVNKVLEGRPHIIDLMTNGDIDLVFNTTEGLQALEDSRSIRRSALSLGIPYYTTISGIEAVVLSIVAYMDGPLDVSSLQTYISEERL